MLLLTVHLSNSPSPPPLSPLPSDSGKVSLSLLTQRLDSPSPPYDLTSGPPSSFSLRDPIDIVTVENRQFLGTANFHVTYATYTHKQVSPFLPPALSPFPPSSFPLTICLILYSSMVVVTVIKTLAFPFALYIHRGRNTYTYIHAYIHTYIHIHILGTHTHTYRERHGVFQTRDQKIFDNR